MILYIDTYMAKHEGIFTVHDDILEYMYNIYKLV